MIDEPDLSGIDASSSLSVTSSMTTNGAAEDLVRSGVSSGDALDSFNNGRAVWIWSSTPLLGCQYRGACRLFKERIAWLRECGGPGHGLAEPNG